MHFSSRVDISAPNPIAAAEAAAKANGIALSKLNDSNPTRHGWHLNWCRACIRPTRVDRVRREKHWPHSSIRQRR